MHTYALQLVTHFQSAQADDERFDRFLEELSDLATRHGISLDEHQSMRLSGSDYRIRPCDACGHLTVNRADVTPDIENMLPDFWFYARRGAVDDVQSVCDLCIVSRPAA
jgi:hypothetical protein